MKKGIIVLLIAVLVAGFAFAGKLTGDATIKFDTDLKAKTWGFANTQSWKYTFSFEYDTTKVEVKGETKAWAELAITGSAKAAVSNGTAASANFNNTYTVSLSKADIVFLLGEKELRFGILNAGSATDYAKAYWGGNAAYNVVKGPSKILPGFTVSYDGFTGGFGARGRWTEDDSFYNMFLHAETKKFEFAEKKVNVQAGIWATLSNDPSILGNDWKDNKIFGGSVKAHYGLAADKKAGTSESAVVANVAADLKYDTKNELFLFEVAADAKYNITEDAKENVRLDVYLAPGKALAPAKYTGDYEKALLLDAKVSYSGHTFDFGEDVSLVLSGAVEIRDALIDKRELIVSAKEVVNLIEKKTLIFTFTEEYKVLVAKTLAVVARVDYKPEKFSAWAQVSPTFLLDSEESTDLLTQLKFECGIKTTKIVDKAELGLTYTRADFIKVADEIKDKGLISAYAKIAF